MLLRQNQPLPRSLLALRVTYIVDFTRAILISAQQSLRCRITLLLLASMPYCATVTNSAKHSFKLILPYKLHHACLESWDEKSPTNAAFHFYFIFFLKKRAHRLSLESSVPMLMPLSEQSEDARTFSSGPPNKPLATVLTHSLLGF